MIQAKKKAQKSCCISKGREGPLHFKNSRLRVTSQISIKINVWQGLGLARLAMCYKLISGYKKFDEDGVM